MNQVNTIFENISFYTQIEMTKGKHENVQLCHNETFCCEAAYTISNEHSDTRSDSTCVYVASAKLNMIIETN